ncbi:MAG: transcriptional regulator GcvA [Burkholderiales bacterium]|nr:transcriptional regulator GcvA [Burkholderiales bacterium]
MSSSLPPLNSLRAFEAAARHLSFRKAAEELHVTPAAISHQLKALEDFLGIKLFRRANRRVELTPAARVAAQHLHEGFKAIFQAVEKLREGERDNLLTVSAAPSFAGKWLMPRLHRFVSRYPQIDVRLSARMRSLWHASHGSPRRDINDTSLDDADVAIRFGDGHFPGLDATLLLTLSVAPMLSPQLAHPSGPLKHPADLKRYPLLHDDTAYFASGRQNWDCWLDAVGALGIDTSRGVHFSHANLAIEAAIDGLGVVLSLPALAAGDIAAGRLFLPFERLVPADYAYYIVCEPGACKRPAIRAFTDWLLEEVARPVESAPALS